jgi:signal transduction histidine kinase
MMGRIGRGHTPLFLRMFGLMLLTVLLVQMLNIAVLFLVPPPQPVITPLDQIAAVFRGTKPVSGELHLRPGAINDHVMLGRDAAVHRALARLLDIPETAVRVQSEGPGFGRGGPLFGPNGPPPPPNGLQPMRPAFEVHGELVMIGSFAISAQIDGQWRTIGLSARGSGPWRRGALLWLAVAMIVVAPVAWFLARSLARPIGLFAEAARRLGRNPKAAPLELSGPPEIREAASAFNEMQSRLNRYVEDRTTLMAAIAHDLRTPLMRLGLRLEHVPDELRGSCESDIRDMEQMIGAVMAFVRDMSRPSRRQRLDLQSLAQSVADDFLDEGTPVLLHGDRPIILEGDAPALKSLLVNLTSNALKYAGNAELSVQAEDGTAIIEVRDAGPGMTDDDLRQAFEPFFRAERSRSRDTGGIGLGLASVRAVARAHGGEATLANSSEGGLIARVTLPL